MSKRYLRLDIEYESDSSYIILPVSDNIKRILKEDMPYCKIRFSRDTPFIEDLNIPYIRPKT